MKRRSFTLSAASALAASSLALPVWAQAQPKEGKDYTRLGKPVATDAPAGKVEVIEFFWYNCGHCNTFEPVFESWAKGAEAKGVVARRVPVAFNASFVPQQKLFYALQGMGKVAEIHPRVFRAIHVEKINLSKEDAIMAWMAKQPGIDMAKFKEMYASFNVASQVQRATQLQEAYGVEGTPSM
ncbi:MAG: thiol:disulfide interchange protein DsbA/DsbL, partial [Burkholderiaceae bacterium]|nr:thiol:disulfide interchange protein DsbA/DsbL [Burkholderiaceae bacterium]